MLATEDSLGKNSANEAELLENKEKFSSVVNCHKLVVVIISSLLQSSCHNLRNYAISVLIYIRRHFLSKWQDLLSKQLNNLQYPQCVLPPSHQG